MKVLYISDSHLQDWVFTLADKIMDMYNYDLIVVSGDIVDSHYTQDLYSYSRMFEACVAFAKKYKSKLIWLYGNHEIPYIYPTLMCSQHCYEAEPLVTEGLENLQDALGKSFEVAARVDNVLFSHAVIADHFVCRQFSENPGEEEWDNIINYLNHLRFEELWKPYSPLWYRPTYDYAAPYNRDGCIQVVGHTPVKQPILVDNVLLTDTFWPDGVNCFTVIDTETNKFWYIDKELNLIGDVT